MTSAHAPTFDVKNYPGSMFAERITWACSCGKSGTVSDGRSAPTMERARAAHARHTTAAASDDEETSG